MTSTGIAPADGVPSTIARELLSRARAQSSSTGRRTAVVNEVCEKDRARVSGLIGAHNRSTLFVVARRNRKRIDLDPKAPRCPFPAEPSGRVLMVADQHPVAGAPTEALGDQEHAGGRAAGQHHIIGCAAEQRGGLAPRLVEAADA